MQNFHAPQARIHVIVRAILFQGENIVLCRVKGQEKFFLPGGHVENGETVKRALLRELDEEIGSYNYQLGVFAGVCEGIFSSEKDTLQQEVNILFEVRIPEGEIVSQENHIEFVCVDRDALSEHDIMPTGIKDGILEWLERKTPFFRDFQQ